MNGLGIYMKELERYPVLSEDEVIRLAKLKDKGNKDALNQLVLANLRFVITVAKRYRKKYPRIAMLDLIQSGNVGLIEGVKRFNHAVGTKILTYVVHWIEWSIRGHINENKLIITVPGYMSSLQRKISATRNKLSTKLEREPDIDEIAKALDESPSKIALCESLNGFVSLDEYVSDNGGDFLDVFRSHKPEVLTYLRDEQINEAVSEALDNESEKDKKMICLRFGLMGYDSHMLKDIGSRPDINLTKERVRQRIIKTLSRVKKRLKWS